MNRWLCWLRENWGVWSWISMRMIVRNCDLIDGERLGQTVTALSIRIGPGQTTPAGEREFCQTVRRATAREEAAQEILSKHHAPLLERLT